MKLKLFLLSSILFCVSFYAYCQSIKPSIVINWKTGDKWKVACYNYFTGPISGPSPENRTPKKGIFADYTVLDDELYDGEICYKLKIEDYEEINIVWYRKKDMAVLKYTLEKKRKLPGRNFSEKKYPTFGMNIGIKPPLMLLPLFESDPRYNDYVKDNKQKLTKKAGICTFNIDLSGDHYKIDWNPKNKWWSRLEIWSGNDYKNMYYYELVE